MVDTDIFNVWDLTGSRETLRETLDERFAAMVKRQSTFVFRVAYAILRNKADAEDAAQDTFLKLYRLRGWEDAADEKGYLARAVWRAALERKRRNSASHTIQDGQAARNPEELAIAADQEAWVHRLIDALPEELRWPLALSSIEGLTSAQISQLLGVPEGTVRSRTARARELLKSKIKERYGAR